MKAGIITHYNVHNHGALLQLYGLKQILGSCGCTAKALTFKKNFDFLEAGLDKKYDISIKSLFYYLKYLKQSGLKRTLFNYLKKKQLDVFRRSLVGEYYSRAKDLEAVFIGSDEVFSLESGLNPLFYGYGVPCKNIYSYAGSFGPYTLEQIKTKNLCSYVNGGLSLFKKVSVRDKNSYDIIKSISGVDAQTVCDPVILYGFKNEQSLHTVKLPKEKYILIYAYDNNMNTSDEVNLILKYARENNLMVVSVGFYHKWCDKNINATPLELLQYFKHAKYVVTDTFHGSVLSLITKSEFITKIRNNGNKLLDLLEKYSVSDRITTDFCNIGDVFSNKINYDYVNHLLEESRNTSLSFVKECLEEAENAK